MTYKATASIEHAAGTKRPAIRRNLTADQVAEYQAQIQKIAQRDYPGGNWKVKVERES